MTENEIYLVGALQKIEARLCATEIAQQLVALHLSEFNEEAALNIANTLANVADSEKVKITSECKIYFESLAKQLRGEADADIIGLQFSESPKEPIPWLKGVINSGKKS